jgi:hypothetical protein
LKQWKVICPNRQTVECAAWGGDYPIIGQKLGASFMTTNRIQESGSEFKRFLAWSFISIGKNREKNKIGGMGHLLKVWCTC